MYTRTSERHSINTKKQQIQGGKPQKSQKSRTAEAGRELQRPSGPAPCANRATCSRLPRTASQQILKISRRETPHGNLCQGSITHTAQECSPVFRQNLPSSSLCPLPLILALGNTTKSLAPSSGPSLDSVCL